MPVCGMDGERLEWAPAQASLLPSADNRCERAAERVSAVLRRFFVLSWFASALALALPGHGSARAGALDATFGGDGRVVTNFTASEDFAVGLAIQPDDGKIVAAGGAIGRQPTFALARYNPGGRLDTTFGGDGRVRTNFTRGFDTANDVVLQPDGKIVAAGRAGGRGGRFALARYNANGTLDSTFGGDGRVTTNFTRGDDVAFGVLIQVDGKIVAVGRAGNRRDGRFAVARYNANGSLDATFSRDGRATTNFTPREDRADMLAIQADGKIVAAGFTARGRFALVRYKANGRQDRSFGRDGKVTTNFTPGRRGALGDGAYGVLVQGDGRILAVGLARGRVALARYNTNGRLDTSFSRDGKVRTNFTSGVDHADDVELQGDGKIVVAGGANLFRRTARFALARYRTNGRLDRSFGGDGKVMTNFRGRHEIAFNLALQPGDGKIVAVGAAGRNGQKFALARYLAS